ncbi:MAG: hypothetical protein L0Y58_21655 [Verrucomicrobia subdivision 3 bacterium]|nr:hypothetical protein [Limisphaerales bacterium]
MFTAARGKRRRKNDQPEIGAAILPIEETSVRQTEARAFPLRVTHELYGIGAAR